MNKIELKHVYKHYEDQVVVLNDICLTIREGEFVVIQGPSGTGKSSLIRMIAGLETVSSGLIYIDGQPANDWPADKRNIAMVFQTDALFPSLSVYENIAFGLSLKMDSKKIREAVQETARWLEIESLLKRKPSQLSAGQKQRVALGRAIVRDARIFLMDEPLSNLDKKLRVEMSELIVKIHKQLNATTIYVTHDDMEANQMADRIVFIEDGRIRKIVENIKREK